MSQRECGFLALRFAELGSNSVNVADFLSFFSLSQQQRHAMQARALVRTSRDAFELVNSPPSTASLSAQKSVPPKPDVAPPTIAKVAPVLTKPELAPAAEGAIGVKPAEAAKEDNVDKDEYDAEDEEEEEEEEDDRLFAAAARQMALQKETSKAESASPTKAVSEIKAFEPIESPVKPSKPAPVSAPAPTPAPAPVPAPSPLKSNVNVIPKPVKPSPEKSVSDVGVFDLDDSYFDDD
jgi:hypothetical protein